MYTVGRQRAGSEPWGEVVGDGDYFTFENSTFYGPVYGSMGQAAAPPAVASTLPTAPAVFTGRADEAAELLRVLDPGVAEGPQSIVIYAVAGLGGVGKTALALHVAHEARRRGWLPGGALFIDMRGYDDVPASADQAVLSLLRSLGVPNQNLPSIPQEQYSLYRAELSRREPVVIVLDNASLAEQIAPLLPGDFPPGAAHRHAPRGRRCERAGHNARDHCPGQLPDVRSRLHRCGARRSSGCTRRWSSAQGEA